MKLKLFKKSTDYSKSTAAMAAIDKFVKAKAMKFDLNKNEAHIMPEIHWEDKDRSWRNNFLKNLQTYIHMRRIMNKKEPLSIPLKVHNLQTGELIIEKVIK